MKKKAVLAMEPLPVKRTSKKYKFVAAAETVKLKEEKYLIIDIFKNISGELKKPLLRIALTEKEYSNYDFGTQKWNAMLLDNIALDRVRAESAYMSQEHTKRIESFAKGHYNNYTHRRIGEWAQWVEALEDSINFEKTQARNKLRRERLKYRIDNMPEIPEGMQKWMQDVFDKKHLLVYQRKGRYAEITCTKCRQTVRRAVTQSESYEGQFEPLIHAPKHGEIGVCPNCVALGTYIAKGKFKKVKREENWVCTAQPFDEGTVVLRYFTLTKIFTTNLEEEEYIDEIMREFFVKGQCRQQKDYRKIGYYTGEEYWDDCNLSGLSNITVQDAQIYPGTYEQLEGTHLQYSGLKEYATNPFCRTHIPVKEYLETYSRYPFIEMLSKLGLKTLLEEMVIQNTTRHFNTSGKNMMEILQIDKKKLKKLIEHNGSTRALEIYQMEKRWNIDIPEETENMIIDLGIPESAFNVPLQYMSVRQFLNRAMKYAGVVIDKVPAFCGHACINVRAEAVKYSDYLTMRRELGYDMTNTVYLYPADLETEHDKMVLESNKKAMDKQKKEKNIQYAGIHKKRKTLEKTYRYKDKEYIVRVPQDAAEIIEEGRYLHHCVGGDGYLSKHSKGTSTILFVRKAAEPNTPFVTMEIQNDTIVQWYGMNDKKNIETLGLSECKMDKWLEEYMEIVKERENAVRASA